MLPLLAKLARSHPPAYSNCVPLLPRLLTLHRPPRPSDDAVDVDGRALSSLLEVYAPLPTPVAAQVLEGAGELPNDAGLTRSALSSCAGQGGGRGDVKRSMLKSSAWRALVGMLEEPSVQAEAARVLGPMVTAGDLAGAVAGGGSSKRLVFSSRVFSRSEDVDQEK